ncbi:glycine cleavage system protein T [Pilimelia terevasa]|uniref:Glycine cleavage system protein T n=1 Tax=Pilimelia terevasa TaxID=53372 RepID=A0A8J3BKV7_9ACTN|nr:folate-binding protein YgfZ [Pilimelia terevasa]GGK29687.1 glycine cleavage system protein T [Pilimelia terevasa]
MIARDGAVPVDALDPATPDQPDPAHRAAGVGAVAAHYGDPAREQRVLERAAGLVDRSHRGVLTVTGPERLSWLHSITTQHLSALAGPAGTELLVLSPNGHIEGHASVAELDGTVWLDTEPGAAAGLLAFLERMRFLTRVQTRDETAGWAVLSLVGPEAPQASAALGAALAAPPRVAPVPGPKFPSGTVPPTATSAYPVAPLPGGGFARRGRLGVDLVVPRDRVDAVADTLGVPVCGLWAYEAVRVAARIARVGPDTDHRTIPAEVDLVGPAVHLDKGCYRGQETVARVHNLGRPPRRLALLHLDGVATDQPPAPGTPVTNADGRAVGFVGTAVRHHEWGMVALAVIKRSVADDAPLRVGPSAAAVEPAAV